MTERAKARIETTRTPSTKRSIPRRAALLLAPLVFSCARSSSSPPPRPVAAATVARPDPQTRAAASLRQHLVAWIVVSDLDGAMARLAAQVGSPGGTRDAAGARDALLEKLGATPAIAETIDTRRAIAIAFLDPTRGAGRSMLMALPLVSSPEFRAALAVGRPERTVGTRRVYGVGADQIFVEIRGTPGREIAYLAWDATVADGAVPLLSEIASSAPPVALALHASIERLAKCCAPDLEAVTGALLALVSPAGSGAAYGAFGLRNAARALSLAALAGELDVRIEIGREATTLSLRASAPEGSPFAAEIAAQPTGAPWGVDLVPDDAMLVHATRLGPAERGTDAEALTQYLTAVAPDPAAARRVDPWRRELPAFARLLSGEVIYAVWPADGGGIGSGGAFRVTDGDAARAALRRLYDRGGAALGPALAHQVGLDPVRFRFRAELRASGARLGGTPVDVVELRPRFPADADHERKMIAWLFDARPTLAFTVVGDRVIWAAGRDWRERLTFLIDAAHGRETSTVGGLAAFREAARDPGRVSFAYLPTARLAGFVVAAVREQGGVDPSHESSLAPFMADVDAVVRSGSRIVRGGGRVSYEVATTVPAVILSDLGMIGGAMWRVAVSPLFGMPAIPPLPAPPPTITPPAAPPAPAPPTPPQPPAPDLPTGRGA